MRLRGMGAQSGNASGDLLLTIGVKD